jgi:peptidoglycan hydrolase-like protein with peptidoglycan-binding domain
MKRALLLLTMLSLATLARADDQTREVQQALKDQGFYYAAIDGNPGSETDAAIRRYQIRQGLDVTGKLDSQTLTSLNLGGASQSSSDTAQATPPPPPPDATDSQPSDQQATPPPRVVQSDRDFLRSQPDATPAPPADDQEAAPQPFEPQPGQAVLPPYQARAPMPAYSDFLRKTPYETAPAVVQQNTVRTAQARLGRQGFFRGDVDGTLSKSFSHALSAYQYDTDMKVTGRLDMETLASLNLLPQRRMTAPPPPPDGPLGGVYRGIWVH